MGSSAADTLRFQRRLMFHDLIGNADAHAKNYALLYRNQVPDLAPMYDAICTAAYPRLSTKMAMALGGRSVPETIQLAHRTSLVPPTKAAKRMLVTELTGMADAMLPQAMAGLGPGGDCPLLSSAQEKRTSRFE